MEPKLIEEFEQKALIVNRVQRINEQLEELNKIGEVMCEKEHCEAGIKLKLIDYEKKHKEEAYDEISPEKIFSALSVGWSSSDNEDKYTDSVGVDLTDKAVIRLIGFLIRELQEERKILVRELENQS